MCAWVKRRPTYHKPNKRLSPPAQGTRLVVNADGLVEEHSPATGRSVLIPAAPSRSRGVDISPGAPGWLSAWKRRYLGY
jgi:hypothetical protein